MLPIRRLLLAVDESEVSANVWQEARMLAALFEAEIVPAHVTLDDASTLPELSTRIGDRLTGSPELKRTEVHVYRPGLSIADAILSAAKDHRADMIVLGAGKKSTLERVFLGSTAETITRRAPIPVWVARPADSPTQLKTVLCAVDSSPAARAALSGAIELARSAKAKLIALAVVSKAKQGPDPVLVMELELRKLLEEVDQAGVDLWVEVLEGDDPIAEILKQADSTACDLLVLGQAGRAGLQRLWKANTAEALIRSNPSSLLTIHS